MKSLLKYTTATAAVLAVTSPVHAGQYVSIFGGATFIQDQSAHLADQTGTGTFANTTTGTFLGTLTSFITSGTFVPTFTSVTGNTLWIGVYNYQWSSGTYNSFTTLDAEYEFDAGFVIGAAWGCDLGNLSVEGEISYRQNNFDAIVDFSSAFVSSGVETTVWFANSWLNAASGWTYVGGFIFTGTFAYPISTSIATAYVDVVDSDINSMSIMANVWYDFPTIGEGEVTPFIGGGVGWASVEVSVGGWNDDDSGFAYQAGAGLRFAVNEKTNLSIEYRYFAAPDMEFHVEGNELGLDYEVNEIIVALRYNF